MFVQSHKNTERYIVGITRLSLSGHILITSMFALFTYLRPAAAATTSSGSSGVGLGLNDPARETYLWKTVIYLSRGSDLNFLNCQVLKNVIGLNI